MGRPRKFAEPPDPEDIEGSEPLPIPIPVSLEDDPIVRITKTPPSAEELDDIQNKIMTYIPDIVKDVTHDVQKMRFLIAFAEMGNRSRAARLVGVNAATVWQWRRSDRKFAAAYTRAEEIAVDLAEDELVRRATEGIIEPVFQGGHLVGGIRKFNDQLLMFYLKANKPEKYRDQTDINVKHDVADRLIKARERAFGRLTSGDGEEE